METAKNEIQIKFGRNFTKFEQHILEQTEEIYTSKIQQFAKTITLAINGSLGSEASIVLSAGDEKTTQKMDLTKVRESFAKDDTAIEISAGCIQFNSGTLIINSDNFKVSASGVMEATGATINGKVITEYSSYKAMLDGGGLDLYFDDVLCGTINTKYWSGASNEGISLRIEEGGNYIMFSHPSDAGTGYDVDYYLNYGWSTNYDEKHIFQTSARFLSDVYLDGRTDIGSLVLRGPGGKRYLVTAYDGVLECSEI